MAVGVMDAPDQLTEVKVCPQYNLLIFVPPPPRISDFCGAFCFAGGAFGRPCIDPTTTTAATTGLLLRIHFFGVFTLAIIRSKSYGEGLILLIFSIKIKNRGSCCAQYGALV